MVVHVRNACMQDLKIVECRNVASSYSNVCI